MKELNEQINEVMNARETNAAKREQLVKLGLRPFDIQLIFGQYKTSERKGRKFDAANLTFGVEIECYNIRRDSLINSVTSKSIKMKSEGYNHADNKEYFKLVSDGSICGANSVECVSPILKGKSGENALKAVCESLNELGAKTNKSTGLHVHIEARKLSEAHICRIVRNYAKLEKAIDGIMPESRRADNNIYCKSLAYRDLNVQGLSEMRRSLNFDRYYKINLEAYLRHKTIEFRQHSGTTDYKKIAMWLRFIREIINYSHSNEIEQACEKLSECDFLSEELRNYAREREHKFANA